MKHIFAILLTGFLFTSSAQEKIPKGKITTEFCKFQFAVYLLKPFGDIENKTKNLIKTKYKDLVYSSSPVNNKIAVSLFLETEALKNYAPQDLDSLKYFGRGLTREQAVELQKSNTVLQLNFKAPTELSSQANLRASQLLHELTDLTKGIAWDEATRMSFSAQKFKEWRIDSYLDGKLDIKSHISIHSYKDGDFIRSITLGMEKFGLPDIEISDFNWSVNKNIGNLINLTAQLLYEKGNIVKDGELTINVKDLKTVPLKKFYLSTLKENAKESVSINLIKGKNEQGDPNNRIIELSFTKFEGASKQQRIETMLDNLWGFEDNVAYIKHNEMILAASKKAKAKLPELRKMFLKGLAPGEFIMVKAPFKTPDDGTEWMWVEVIKWKDLKKIQGILKNQPYHIPTLKAGADVSVDTAEIFDYIYRKADGTSEGNETGKLIEKFQSR